MGNALATVFLMLFAVCTWAQTTVEGRVEADGKPLAFANVVLVSTGVGTVTDPQGRFRLQAPEGTYVLEISSVGFITHRQPLTVGPQSVTLAVELQEDQHVLSEIVIQSTRHEEYVALKPSESLRISADLIEVPQNISVTTRQTMSDWGILSTSEMARTVSGVIKSYGDYNDFSFIMRGTDVYNNVFRNGVGGYWWNQQEDVAMIEKVEFVKGPAGFMIGNAEPGGLVNVVTKQPTVEETKTVEVGYGSWNMLRGSADFGGALTSDKKLTYRLVAGGQRQETPVDFTNTRRTFVMPALRYAFNGSTHVQFDFMRMDARTLGGTSPSLPSINGQLFALPNSFAVTDPNTQGLKTYDNYSRLSVSHRFNSGWKLNAQVARVNGLYGGDGMYISGLSPAQDTVYRNYFRNDWRNELTAAQAFIDGTFFTGRAIKHSVLAGIDFGDSRVNSAFGELTDEEKIRALDLSLANPGYRLPENLFTDVEWFTRAYWGQRWLALYAQDHMKIHDKVVVTLAGRLTQSNAWSDEGVRVDSTTVRDVAFAPRLGLTYLFNDHFSAYALYDQTFLPQIGQTENREMPKPLTGQNAEIGLKGSFFQRRMNTNLTAYQSVKNDVLVQNPASGLYVQRGQITSRGVEFDLTGNISAAVVAIVNYTYTDAKVTDDPNPDLVGFPNFGTPAHAGNAMVRYKFLRGWLNGFSVGAGVQYMGARTAVWAGWSDVADRDVRTPDYTLLDANVAYAHDRFSITLNVFNLLNERFVSSGWFNSASDTSPAFWGYTPGNPLNFRLGCQVKL